MSEVFHAWFHEHAYPGHAHGTWTLFIVDEGVVTYGLDRHAHDSTPPMVTILPPHVVHDGRPATNVGFHMRVVYLDAEVLGEELIGRAVDKPIITDRSLRAQLSMAHDVLCDPDEALEAETRLAVILDRIEAHLGAPASGQLWVPGSSLASQLRDLLDAHITEPLTLALAGQRIGARPAHLVRTFKQSFGIPPHAYVIGRRVELARQRLLQGQPPADVAIDVGFHDQAHLTRSFKRHVGTTPGRYAENPVNPRLQRC